MGMRSPQDIKSPALKPTGATRFQGAVPSQIDKTFLQTASNAIDRFQQSNDRAKVHQLEDIKTMADNDAENDVIVANAELSQVSGLNTMDKQVTLRDKLKKQLDARREKIPSQFHPYVDQIYAKKMTRYNKFAIPYTLGEIKKVRDTADKTYLKNAMQEAIEESGDPDNFAVESLGRVEAIAAQKAYRQFGDQPDIIGATIKESVSKTVLGAIEQQATLGHLDKARTLSVTRNAELTPDDRVKAQKILDKNSRDIETINAVRIAEQAAALEDPEAAEAFVRNSVSSFQGYSSSTAALRTIKKAQKDGEKFYDGKAVSAVFKDLDDGKGLDPHKLNAIQDPLMKDRIIEMINKNGGIANRTTDRPTYRALVNKMFSNPESFKTERLENYQAMLSQDDYKFVVSKQTALKQRDTDRQDKIDYSTDKMVQDIMRSSTSSLINSHTIKDEDIPELQLRMMEFQDRLIRNSKGLNERDIRRRFAEQVSKYQMKTEKRSSLTNLYGLLPWGEETTINPYIPVGDYTEDQIDAVREKTSWPVEKILRFLDSQKKLK